MMGKAGNRHRVMCLVPQYLNADLVVDRTRRVSDVHQTHPANRSALADEHDRTKPVATVSTTSVSYPRITAALATLTDAERLAVVRRFGLDGSGERGVGRLRELLSA